MAARWNRPHHGGDVLRLTVLWPGMTAPITFVVEQYRFDDQGWLEVVSGELTPYVAVLPTATPMFLVVDEVTPPIPPRRPEAQVLTKPEGEVTWAEDRTPCDTCLRRGNDWTPECEANK